MAFARMAKERGCDAVDVSSAGNVPESARPRRMYEVRAERIRYEADIKVQCVGAVPGIDHANTVLAAGRADLVAMARPHLEDPYLTLRAANELRVPGQFWPRQYMAARRR